MPRYICVCADVFKAPPMSSTSGCVSSTVSSYGKKVILTREIRQGKFRSTQDHGRERYCLIHSPVYSTLCPETAKVAKNPRVTQRDEKQAFSLALRGFCNR